MNQRPLVESNFLSGSLGDAGRGGQRRAEGGMAWGGWGSAGAGPGFPGRQQSKGWEHGLDLTSPLGSEELQTVISDTEASQQVNTGEVVHLSAPGLLPGLELWGSESRNAEMTMCDRRIRP